MKKIYLICSAVLLSTTQLASKKTDTFNFLFDNPTSYTTSTLPSILASGAADVAIQADGKIIVATPANFNITAASITLKRYNTDSSLDTTFGTSGTLTQTIGDRSGALDLIAQPDGKILICGYSIVENQSRFLIARYNNDGSLDTTFNAADTPGYRITSTEIDSRVTDAMLWKMTLQSDNKIVATGYYRTSDNAYTHIAVVRYNTDGTIDTTFGNAEISDGITRIAEARHSIMATDIITLNDDAIILGGFFEYTPTRREFYITKLTSSGAIDTTFGEGYSATKTGSQKKCVSGQADELWGLALQSNGKIIGIGSSNGATFLTGTLTIVRYNTNGTIDTSFGSQGLIISQIPTATIALAVKNYANNNLIIGSFAQKADFYAKRFIQYNTATPQQLLNIYVE